MTVVEQLTSRQQEILMLIEEMMEESGMPPTRAELADALGFRSVNAAEQHLRALARKGAIELRPNASRGIRLLATSGLPVVGRVAAGSPLLAEEHIETHYRLDPALFSRKAHYLLRVTGMSMRDAGILDGDLVAVHRTPDVANGHIVVARVDDEVTVKRYKVTGHRVWLYPENPEFEPIVVDTRRHTVVIEGVVVGVVRNEGEFLGLKKSGRRISSGRG